MKAMIVTLGWAVLLGVLLPTGRAEDFGITKKTFDQPGLLHSVFTFRRGKLIYERTIFLAAAGGLRQQWMERFYAANAVIFTRTGAPKLEGERSTGAGKVAVTQSSYGHRPFPARLSLGGEAYDLGDDGFYQLIANPRQLLEESIISAPEFSTGALDRERARYLHPEIAPAAPDIRSITQPSLPR